MSSYTSKLKTWGASGSEYPNGYNYVAGEQPVDEWDNYLTNNVINDLKHLISLTNDRLETDSGTSHPSSPEPGHVSHRTDGVVTTDEELFFYDNTNSVWHRLFQADGDTMTGILDMGGYRISDVGEVYTTNDAFTVHTSGTGTGGFTVQDDANSKELIDAPEGGEVELHGTPVSQNWYSSHSGGTVSAGAVVSIGQFGVDPGETLEITQATFSEDGFTTVADSGIELIIADENAVAGDSTTVTTVLAGDGTTLFDDETGTPLASYTNSGTASVTVMIAIDNGHFVAGSGADTSAHGSYVARLS